MYNDRITLTMQDILEKEFKIDARGYRLQEVDKFLDVIIKDYNEYKYAKKVINGYYAKNKDSYFRKVFDYSILKNSNFEKRKKDK